MSNICSFWEINPLTSRVRVRAPKTKAEPYPDYDTEEEGTARLVAGLCNRTIPIGNGKKVARKRKGRDPEEEERGSSDEGEITQRKKLKTGSEFVDNYDDEVANYRDVEVASDDEYENNEDNDSDDAESANDDAAQYNRRSTNSRKRRRDTRSVDKYTNRGKKSANERAKISKRANRYQISPANEHESEFSEQPDDGEPFTDEGSTADSYDQQLAEPSKQNTRNRKRIREQSVIVENPAHKFKRRREGFQGPVGSVITVPKPKPKPAPVTAKRTKRGRKRRRNRDVSRSPSPGAQSASADSDSPVIDTATNFWSRY
ncbi:Oidioi.mRNA.OKI2018_I69.PAR.g12700.t1.cds [Oikopleura dioica]|uniref:Oidioi.mRNA.OKI2018_I69.PAR.g12700.t1.cds n=1 Tax=Oikopleura dioica TaxID=34765 RepID=A0ABN7S556_OIKDI|nr:Oidioi.mRNA.OKI2018_I69.PAR.g12700.t1.cds [Oikopleura dioica]